jgi:arginyl-tRNA--protein-N-Asp/Glu arginylyltransferase
MSEILEALRCAKQFIDAMTQVHDPDSTNETYDTYRAYLSAMDELPAKVADFIE